LNGRKTSVADGFRSAKEIFQPLLLEAYKKGEEKRQADMEDVGVLVRDLLSQTDLDV
jgi:hypothetical protein